MNQQKIGAFLKQLRNEKNYTQEQFAEKIGVTRRTVSRWENGNNLPDISVLIEIADFYEVDLRELLDGERKCDIMNNDVKETAEKVNNYNKEAMRKFKLLLHVLYIIGIISFIMYFVLMDIKNPSHALEFIQGLCLGIPFGTVIIGALMTGKVGNLIRDFKVKQ